jgi:DNA polymerase-3 subunit gamma/tau
MTFYLKYRAKSFDELDITSVRETLRKIVASGNIPHAFLFYGPKGTGKTSAARILAKSLNCKNKKGIEPCNECEICSSISKGVNIDVIEMDAASHRGIEDIRSLREAVKLAPSRLDKKVYIIDEAHMLTPEASNALLKTLEEPPEHVFFILATTNPEKLIPTILSRVVSVGFTKPTEEEYLRALKRIAKLEKLKIGDDALRVIGEFSDGSFRDAVKLLEMLVNENIKMTPEEIRGYLSKTAGFDTQSFLEMIAARDASRALAYLDSVVSKGASVKNITDLLIKRLREELIIQVTQEKGTLPLSREDVIKLLDLFIGSLAKIGYATLEQIPLEIAIADWCFSIFGGVGDNESNKPQVGSSTDERSGIFEKENNEKDSKGRKLNLEDNGESEDIKAISGDSWTKALSIVRQKNASTEALLRAAKPVNFDGRLLTLRVYYSFHKERLESNPHRTILEKSISQVLGKDIIVACKLGSPPQNGFASKTLGKADGAEDGNGEIKDGSHTSEAVLSEEDDDIVKVAEKIFNQGQNKF